jgi:two-component system CheB/CheR fusion protein
VASPRGLRLPIVFLAPWRRITSGASAHLFGMGSDGTLGLRAIKETAGVVLVRSRRRPNYTSRSAIDAGLADIVAPVDELPKDHRLSAAHS